MGKASDVNREKLLSLYRSSNSGAEIAQYFGVSRRTIVKIIQQEREKNPELWKGKVQRGK